MARTVMIVADRLPVTLGLAQAILKFGYQITTARPEADDLDRALQSQPNLMLLCPPAEAPQEGACLGLVKTRFLGKGVPLLVCVATPDAATRVREHLGAVEIVAGTPLRLNELYSRVQALLDLANRRELRIGTELVVAHREVGVYTEDFFYYDTIRSLSLGGCFVQTEALYPIGTEIEMVFCVGSASRSIKTRGTVRHHGQGAGANAGMGIEFQGMSDSDRGALGSFLLSQMGTPGLPSTL